MLRISFPIRRLGVENDAAYSKRAARALADLHNQLIPWGVAWAASVISWACHLIRDTAHATWGGRILHVRSTHELDERRAFSATSRPGTRSQSGFCCRRWTDSVLYACNYITNFKLSGRPYLNRDRQQSLRKLESLLAMARKNIIFVEENILRL